MLCSGALLEVLDGESAYFDPASIQAKERESRRTPLWCVLMRYVYAASLLPNTRVAITTTRATAIPPISEGQGEPVKPATRYPNRQMTATREA